MMVALFLAAGTEHSGHGIQSRRIVSMLCVYCLTQSTDGCLVSGSDVNTTKLENIMSLSDQRWMGKQLFLLLTEASKILGELPELAVIHQTRYPSLRL